MNNRSEVMCTPPVLSMEVQVIYRSSFFCLTIPILDNDRTKLPNIAAKKGFLYLQSSNFDFQALQWCTQDFVAESLAISKDINNTSKMTY